MLRKVSLLIIIVNFICASLVASFSQTVGAVTASDWRAGNIINDFLFTNKSAMSVSQIQTFLNGKVGTGTNGVPGQCDTYGVRTSELGGGTRAQYGAAHGNPIPFTCLKNFYEVPKTTPGTTVPANNYGGKKIPTGARSAARLIWDAAQTYNISPRVLLIKLDTESAGPLTRDDWPFLRQYTYAMGAHCPDSGPGGSANCDADYSGFSIQISEAAKMLRGYLDDMEESWWPYKKPYQINSIYWNVVESGCGASNVYIENKATAALYTYTPYQPNKAALNNMYGTGNSCSAYGNRNFWRTYNDWFGSSYYSDIVRTTTNATVYLVSGDNKYPIANSNILNSLSALGKITYAPQAYLNTKTTGQTMGRVIKGSGNTIYYFDSGIRLAFTSCDQVVDYGYSCGQVATLTDFQISEFSNGPNMTNVYRTTSGKRFYIKSGEKREIYDDTALQQIGVSPNANVLSEAAILNLSYGIPVIRDDVVATSRGTNKKYLLQGNIFIGLPTDLSSSGAFTKLPNNKLDGASIITQTVVRNFNGFAQASSGNKYIIDSQGKTLLSNPEEWLGSYTTLNDTLFNQAPNSTQPINSRFIKVDNGSTIYLVTKGKKYSISSWGDFINLHLDKSTKRASLARITFNSIPTVSTIYAPGNLIKSASNTTVYVVNGILHKIALPSFAISDDFGLGGVRTVSQSDLNAHISDSGSLNNFVSCDSKNYLANRGLIYEIDAQASTMYGYGSITVSTWDDIGCANLRKSATTLSGYQFVKMDDAKTIYYIQNGQKHPLSSMTKYIALGGSTDKLLIVSSQVLNTIDDGPAV